MGDQMTLFDEPVEQAQSFNNLVARYLIYSYQYYILNDNLVSDAEYDVICKTLLENFGALTHPHTYLLDTEALSAGSCFHLKESDYPLIVKETAKMLLREKRGR